MARKVKRRKLNVFRVFIVLVFLALIGLGIYYLSKMPVRGYYIIGNTYYSDYEILSKTKLDKYPSYLFTNSYSVTKNIKNDKLIDSITIKHKVNGMFDVIVNENSILFYDETKKKSILKDGNQIDYYYEYSPVLINDINDKKIYKKFIERFQKLDKELIKNISEIKYDPNDIDKERFLFSMNDGNYVYGTLSKISNINKYLEISSTLTDKKGILYLDYGNYFVPKE